MGLALSVAPGAEVPFAIYGFAKQWFGFGSDAGLLHRLTHQRHHPLKPRWNCHSRCTGKDQHPSCNSCRQEFAFSAGKHCPSRQRPWRVIPSGKLITTQRSCAKPSTAKRTVPPPNTRPLVVNCSSVMLCLSCKPAPRSPASNGPTGHDWHGQASCHLQCSMTPSNRPLPTPSAQGAC